MHTNRNTQIYRIYLLLLCVCAISTVNAQPSSVWVFTTAELPPVRQLELSSRVIVLNDATISLRGLSFSYPGSSDAAKQQALSVINSPQGQTAMRTLHQNMQDVVLAWQLGIEKLPAVIVDQRYVVYGVYDVAAALDKVHGYQNAQ